MIKYKEINPFVVQEIPTEKENSIINAARIALQHYPGKEYIILKDLYFQGLLEGTKHA